MGTVKAPWKQLLLDAVEANAHLKHSSFFQLATVGCSGRPSNRTVVFRGFQEDTDKIQINTDFRTRKQREKSWFASSQKSRLQYLGPNPGLPSLDEQPPKEIFLDKLEGPVDAFCLLVLDPDQVDYLNLKSNERISFTSRQDPNGDKCWTSERINP
ncbi:hypothetical protein TIFTF001_012084 [Ficus carica]|uniref:pyridoxal 5'-phosphate synthase n=1 Tax=Ficus carica TaxID=3494 RepID=A0AA88A1Q9_FICCA|nr:hypothetical protein TIFTF001_012084 [Ficus carica]